MLELCQGSFVLDLRKHFLLVRNLNVLEHFRKKCFCSNVLGQADPVSDQWFL